MVKFNHRRSIQVVISLRFLSSSLFSFPTVFLFLHGNDDHLSQYNIQISEGRASQGVLRLGVQDGDSPYTAAWKVKFDITNGNEEGHFDISTDPETNEGNLSVIKVNASKQVAVDAEALSVGLLTMK